MKTSIKPSLLQTETGRQADAILRNCVHCGFCNATCPTYQLTGNELDGPRGRIYLIKQVLEGHRPGAHTQLHLDRCLNCRNCETTCPSGVHYSRLFDIGQPLVAQAVPRPFAQRLFHTALRGYLLSPLFALTLRMGRLLRPVAPASIKKMIPPRNAAPDRLPDTSREKKVLLVRGCVQKSLQPSIDAAAAHVFNTLGIQTVIAPSSRCCGALSHHLNAKQDALHRIRQNIDAWLPLIEKENIECITMTASGCGVMIRDYEYVLGDDREYADKARLISAAYRDPIEIVESAGPTVQAALAKNVGNTDSSIAFHPPCTLQHGQKINGRVESLLRALGYRLTPFADSHLCCGSAGTYSITQKSLSQKLLRNKLAAIESQRPEMIVTANIGCQVQLQRGTVLPVRHWLELLVPCHQGTSKRNS